MKQLPLPQDALTKLSLVASRVQLACAQAESASLRVELAKRDEALARSEFSYILHDVLAAHGVSRDQVPQCTVNYDTAGNVVGVQEPGGV